MEGFFSLTPPHPAGNSGLASNFLFKVLAFKTPPPPPLGISVNLPWGGYGHFLEHCTISRKSILENSVLIGYKSFIYDSIETQN